MRKIYLTLVLGLFLSFAQAQITAPDTVCRGTTVNYTTTTTASNYVWAPENVDITPTNIFGATSVSLKSFGKPGGVCMKQDANGDYFAFITIEKGSLIRLEYGSDPFGSPTVTPFGNLGVLTDSTKGIDIVNDNGNWYGIVVCGRKIVRLTFGASLTNTPTAAEIPIPFVTFYMANPYQVSFVKYNGGWLAFVVSHGQYPNPPAPSNPASIARLDFGSSITSTPTMYNIYPTGNPNLRESVAFSLQQYNNNWYMLVLNKGGGSGSNGSLSRYDFGSDLKSFIVTASNIGNPNGGSNTLLNNGGALNLIADCDQLYALVPNTGGTSKHVIKVDFADNNVSGIASATDLGDLGIPKCSANFTSPFWYNNRFCMAVTSLDSSFYLYDNIYTVSPNAKMETTNNGYSNTLTSFGNYTLTLHADQGQASGPMALCKDVYSLDAINIAIKQIDTIMVAKGAKCDVYEWRFNGVVIPGAITDTLTGLVDGGVYTVIGYKSGCSSFSTVMYHSPTGISSFNASAFISVYPNPSTGMFNIKAEGIEANSVTINCYNMVGSLVRTLQAKTANSNLNTSIDLTGLPKGVYQLKLQTEQGNYIKQVVLQ